MSENYTRSLGEIVTGATTAALATVTQKPPWAHIAKVTVSTDSNYLFCPELRKVWLYENGAGSYTDLIDNAKDKNTSTKVILDSFADDDYLYIAADEPFRGIAVDVSAANGTASVITVDLSDGDGTWTDSSDTDGTISSGKTLAVDGLITWTIPTTWLPDTVNGMEKLYWVRISVSSTLDSEVELDSLTLLNRETVGASIETATGGEVEILMGGKGGLEFTAAAGTPANAIQWLGR